ncbi:MAG: hypothetical protein M1818_005934 [Claussenomyces sp. TS43310]|nr:MAG: hypothetical protein M1818_005934 [Claussenomyces sp. TS43310]
MPLGFERINARKKQPNDNLNFIKPLDGADSDVARDYLERIAAIVYPIMKRNHIYVMSLEEYAPNPEFLGRNFNAGEVIQLVLKTRSGHWYPFKHVEMVMIHELSHCKQMNHSKAFWNVRNGYADELKVLWSKGYTGEGLWGRGVALFSGKYELNPIEDSEVLPEHLCGGTFKSSRKRKRKQKDKLSYRQQQARRIARKFGSNGVALGADDEVKTKLEKGKKPAGKPRIAGSARGRELRAAAALARLETKAEEPAPTDSDGDGSETESDFEEDDIGLSNRAEAFDINGKKLLDLKGGGMVKVCEDDDKDDADAQNEMAELQDYDARNDFAAPDTGSVDSSPASRHCDAKRTETTGDAKRPDIPDSERKVVVQDSLGDVTADEDDIFHHPMRTTAPAAAETSRSSCPVCSLESEPGACICGACAHVLDPDSISGTWRCESEVCKGGQYRNAGDCGVCGICGARKAAT